ncbi:hypothetical protein PLESTM_001892300 [Pleodorina starrii]|nr:hypothetical protein PLESTM_001892300 [Pleodorina starrii]
MYVNRSTFALYDSTCTDGAAATWLPYTWIDGGSSVILKDSNAVFINTTVLLSHSSLLSLESSSVKLHNSTLELWGSSSLVLNYDARVELYDGSKILFACGSTASRNLLNATPPLTGRDQDLLGWHLGDVDGTLGADGSSWQGSLTFY